jgi:hypothetical protein
MAKRHTSNGAYTNPEVRFERTDIETGRVFWTGVIATLVVAVIFAVALWFGVWLFALQAPAKRTDLPKAAVDAERLPPPPRLEGLEDVREKRTRWLPDRAAEYYRPQEKLLRDGGDGVLAIDTAIDALAGKLPAEKASAPADFSVRLPSKSSSGQKSTGGQ